MCTGLMRRNAHWLGTGRLPGTAFPLLGPGRLGLDADTTDSRVEALRSGQDDFAEIGLDPVAHEVRADNHPQPRPAELVSGQAEVVGPVPLGDCCLQGLAKLQ